MALLDVCCFTPTTGGLTDWTYSAIVPGYQSLAAAGAINGAYYRYRAESLDQSQWEVGVGFYNSGTGVLSRSQVIFNSLGTTAKINFSTVPKIGIVLLAEDLQVALPPGGRLTLQSGLSVMMSTVAAATSIIYTFCAHGTVPITYNGLTFYNEPYSEYSQLLSDTTKSPAAALPNACYDIYGWADAGQIRFTRSDYWKKSSTVTITIASPGVVTMSGSDLEDGCPITLATTGALPTGLTAGTQYFAKRIGAFGNPNPTFNLAATVGGSAINTTGTQSGTHTATAGDQTGAIALASGGNCERKAVSGFLLNKNAISNGPAASRGTYVGTIRTNSSSTCDWIFAGTGAGGVQGYFGVWNLYNSVRFGTINKDTSGFNATTTINTWLRKGGNSKTNGVYLMRGLDQTMVHARSSDIGGAGASGQVLLAGVAINALVASGVQQYVLGTALVPLVSSYSGAAFQGWGVIFPAEYSTTASAGFWSANISAGVGDTGFTVEFEA